VLTRRQKHAERGCEIALDTRRDEKTGPRALTARAVLAFQGCCRMMPPRQPQAALVYVDSSFRRFGMSTR